MGNTSGDARKLRTVRDAEIDSAEMTGRAAGVRGDISIWLSVRCCEIFRSAVIICRRLRK